MPSGKGQFVGLLLAWSESEYPDSSLNGNDVELREFRSMGEPGGVTCKPPGAMSLFPYMLEVER